MSDQSVILPFRVVERKGRVRLQCTTDGLYLSVSRAWRDTLRPGEVVKIEARMRADMSCWLACWRCP